MQAHAADDQAELNSLIDELIPAVREVIKDFLVTQQLDTVADLASLHQDDLTEAFKAANVDFTLGHRAAVRRLCAVARVRNEASLLLCGNPSQSGRPQRKTPHMDSDSRGSTTTLTTATNPKAGSCSTLSDDREGGQEERRGTRSGRSSMRSPSPARETQAPREAAIGSLSSRSCQALQSNCGPKWGPCGRFSPAYGRETTWSRLAEKADSGPGFHQVGNVALTTRPASPRVVIGRARRPSDLFASTIGERGAARSFPPAVVLQARCSGA